MKTYLIVPLLMSTAFATPAATGGKTKYYLKKYDMAAATYKKEVVKGPRTIRTYNLNPLRYDYSWTSEVTFDKAPDLWGALTAAAVPADTKAAAAPTAKAPADAQHLIKHAAAFAVPITPNTSFETLFAQCQKDFPTADPLYCEADARFHLVHQKADEINGDKGIPAQVSDKRNAAQSVVTAANTAARQLANAGDDLKALVETSTGVATTLMSALRERLTKQGNLDSSCQIRSSDATPSSTFQKGLDALWPSSVASFVQANESFKLTLNEYRLFIQQSGIEISSLEARIRPLQDLLKSQRGDLQKQAAGKNPPKDSAKKIGNLDGKINSFDEALGLLASAKTELLIDTAYVDYGAKETDTTLAALSQISETGTKYTAFHSAQQELNKWNQRMQRINQTACSQKEDAFSMDFDASCEFAFSQTKKNPVALLSIDHMPATTDTKPQQVLDVTVECTSPFTVSAGVAFSSIQEREFAIVPSSDGKNQPGVVNKFASTAKSSFHPLPLGMIHARLWEGTPDSWKENIGLHASFGMAGNFKSQSSGGSDVEFLAGPSISLFRTMFLTPGLHIGHKVSIGGGFNEGDIVPATITQVPLQKSYKVGFGFAITFTKP